MSALTSNISLKNVRQRKHWEVSAQQSWDRWNRPTLSRSCTKCRA